MADFRTKLIMLAGAVTVFAGMAFGQATLAANAPLAPVNGATFVRAEGTYELLPATTLTVTGAVAGSITVTVYLPAGLTITSQVYGNNKTSETTAVANGGGGTVQGTVAGTVVTFSGITTTVNTTTITITNIRINATTLAVANGVPTGVTEQVFLGGVNATPGVTAPVTVAFALNGLGAYSIPSGNNVGAPAANTTCAGASAATLQFTVNVPENFSQSFKTLAGESGTNANAPATNGTRLALTLGNLPANVTVYTPLTVATSTTNGTGILTLVVSPTATNGASNLETANTGNGLGAFGNAGTPSNGTLTIYYELTTAASVGLLENYPINVYYVAKAGAVAAPQSAATVSVSYAPVGSATNFPSFAVGSSTLANLSGSVFNNCSTSLLFPFLTNAGTTGNQFDTGLAIANTSLDNLASNGTKSSVSAQNGTCSIYFYGTNAPAAPYVTPTVTAGTTWANSVSQIAAGFQGYAIASCTFNYAHGFAYISYDLTGPTGVSMGYLALELPAARPAAGTAELLEN
jgi:hypothetical protein